MSTVSLHSPNRNNKPRTAEPVEKIDRSKQPTRSEIVKYLALHERAASIARKARTIKAEADLIGDKIESFIRHSTKGRKNRSVVRCGYRLALEVGAVRPAWKVAFIAECGEKAAQEVVNNTLPAIDLIVEPVSVKVVRG